MQPDEFISEYSRALASQNWAKVEPLMHPNVCVTFSSGAVHRGLDAVRAAFEANFAAISNEHYRVSEVHWIHRDDTHAVLGFEFDWSGVIDGHQVARAGRGTSVLLAVEGEWKLLAEHLGPRG